MLLIGPPGVGKTAIMRQIADELGCGLVAYSMTHHTRQSAIGLPYIAQREYGGVTWSVTEYTMSEIVAAIYNAMERTGRRSGILFLDEINCVSETLAPVMLQLLQNKTFGNVPLPEDWIIVAAGNPPEYNKSVRELDMVTLDRVKLIDVEASLPIWQRYALAQGVHPAIRTYLTVYPDHFYRITDTDRSQLFVTARGWEDLSLMLSAYEEEGISVGPEWFLQYLQHDEIARSFGLYYDLFRHFSTESQPDERRTVAEALLASPEACESRSSTECLAIAAMLFHDIEQRAARLWSEGKRLARRGELAGLLPPDDAFALEETAREFFRQKRQALAVKVSHSAIEPAAELREQAVLSLMESDALAWQKLPRAGRSGFSAFEQAQIQCAEARRAEAVRQLSHSVDTAYQALLQCPQGRSALLYLTSDLSASVPCAECLSICPCSIYETFLKELEA